MWIFYDGQSTAVHRSRLMLYLNNFCTDIALTTEPAMLHHHTGAQNGQTKQWL